MSEEKELLSRISQLAGHINLRKDRQPPDTRRESYRVGSPSSRTARPYHGRRGHDSRHWFHPPTTHRNRSLVLNQSMPLRDAEQNEEETELLRGADPNSREPVVETPQGATPTHWVSKHDRHRQLINASVFEKNSSLNMDISPATEDPRVKGNGASVDGPQPVSRQPGNPIPQTPNVHYIEIDGSRFQVCNRGSKLRREKGLDDQAQPTPKSAVVSGIEFTRSKNGNLYRSELMIAGRSAKRPPTKKPAHSEPCKRFNRTGQCQFGPKCRFVHDPSKVAICREFLKSGNCPQGSHCDLSHTPSYERVPACTHFIRGNCSKPDCRYAHVRVDPGADVCRAFTELGFCGKGSACKQRHVFECPDYSQSGVCRDLSCRLPHVDRAGQLRKQARKDSGTYEDPGSSRQNDLIEVDGAAAEAETGDVSSEDLDEEIILGATSSHSHVLSQQADFVSF